MTALKNSYEKQGECSLDLNHPDKTVRFEGHVAVYFHSYINAPIHVTSYAYACLVKNSTL